jgi:hypothetical protein
MRKSEVLAHRRPAGREHLAHHEGVIRGHRAERDDDKTPTGDFGLQECQTLHTG